MREIYQWRRSTIFIVNFETDFIHCSSVSIFDLEQVNAGLIYLDGKSSVKAAIKILEKRYYNCTDLPSTKK